MSKHLVYASQQVVQSPRSGRAPRRATAYQSLQGTVRARFPHFLRVHSTAGLAKTIVGNMHFDLRNPMVNDFVFCDDVKSDVDTSPLYGHQIPKFKRF